MIKSQVLENIHINKTIEKSNFEILATICVKKEYLELEEKNFWINYAKKIGIKGFRDGRLPLTVKKALESDFDRKYPNTSTETYIQNLIIQEVSNEVKNLEQFQNDHILDLVYSNINITPENNLEFDLNITKFPNIKNIDLSVYTVPNYAIQVSDTDISNFLKNWLYKNYIGNPVKEDRVIKYGDIVKFDLITQIAGIDHPGSFTIRIGECKMQEIENLLVTSELKVGSSIKTTLNMDPSVQKLVKATQAFAQITIHEILENATYSEEETFKFMGHDANTGKEYAKQEILKDTNDLITQIQAHALIQQILDLPEFNSIDNVLRKTIQLDKYSQSFLDIAKENMPEKYEEMSNLIYDLTIKHSKINLIQQQFYQDIEFSSVEFGEFLKQILPISHNTEADLISMVNEMREMPNIPRFEQLQKMFIMKKSLNIAVKKAKLDTNIQKVSLEDLIKDINNKNTSQYKQFLDISKEIMKDALAKSKENIPIEGLQQFIETMKLNFQNSELPDNLSQALESKDFEEFNKILSNLNLDELIEANKSSDTNNQEENSQIETDIQKVDSDPIIKKIPKSKSPKSSKPKDDQK